MAPHWIQGAVKHPGAFTAKANAAGMSVPAFAAEKASAPGVLGHQARLAQTFEGMHHSPAHKLARAIHAKMTGAE
jgi:hypothetical protein